VVVPQRETFATLCDHLQFGVAWSVGAEPTGSAPVAFGYRFLLLDPPISPRRIVAENLKDLARTLEEAQVAIPFVLLELQVERLAAPKVHHGFKRRFRLVQRRDSLTTGFGSRLAACLDFAKQGLLSRFNRCHFATRRGSS